MPNPIQVTGDDDPFINQQNDIEAKLLNVRQNLQVVPTTVCVHCGEKIGEDRIKALATNSCIDCAVDLETDYKRNSHDH